jgi:hypothetical protein
MDSKVEKMVRLMFEPQAPNSFPLQEQTPSWVFKPQLFN